MAERIQGQLTLGDQAFNYASGGRKYGNVPPGSYPLEGYAPAGTRPSGFRLPSFALPGSIPDSRMGTVQGGQRLGILIHPSSTSDINKILSAGCIAIARDQWPAFKAALQTAQKQYGRVVLSVAADGSAQIQPATAFAGTLTTPDNLIAATETQSGSATAAERIAVRNQTQLATNDFARQLNTNIAARPTEAPSYAAYRAEKYPVSGQNAIAENFPKNSAPLKLPASMTSFAATNVPPAAEMAGVSQEKVTQGLAGFDAAKARSTKVDQANVPPGAGADLLTRLIQAGTRPRATDVDEISKAVLGLATAPAGAVEAYLKAVSASHPEIIAAAAQATAKRPELISTVVNIADMMGQGDRLRGLTDALTQVNAAMAASSAPAAMAYVPKASTGMVGGQSPSVSTFGSSPAALAGLSTQRPPPVQNTAPFAQSTSTFGSNFGGLPGRSASTFGSNLAGLPAAKPTPSQYTTGSYAPAPTPKQYTTGNYAAKPTPVVSNASQPAYNPLAGANTGAPAYNPLAGANTGIPFYNPLAGANTGAPPKPTFIPRDPSDTFKLQAPAIAVPRISKGIGGFGAAQQVMRQVAPRPVVSPAQRIAATSSLGSTSAFGMPAGSLPPVPKGFLPTSAPAGGGYVSSPGTAGGVAYISTNSAGQRVATNAAGATIRLS